MVMEGGRERGKWHKIEGQLKQLERVRNDKTGQTIETQNLEGQESFQGNYMPKSFKETQIVKLRVSQ